MSETVFKKIGICHKNSLQPTIHDLCCQGYEEFNIKIASQERHPDGKITYDLWAMIDRDAMLEEARLKYPDLDIQ